MSQDSLFSRLLYRFGFICIDSEWDDARQRIEALVGEEWISFRSYQSRIWLHPETRYQVVQRDGASLIVIGDCFSADGSDAADLLRGVNFHSDASLYEMLDELFGRFALILSESDRCRIFHDPFGSRSLFYANCQRLAVASHSDLLGRSIDSKLADDIASLMGAYEYENRVVKYLPGDRTVFEDIFALIPNMYFDTRNMKANRYWPRSDNTETSIEAFFEIAEAHLSSFVRAISGRFSPILGITGGVDSRLIFSFFYRAGLPWRGVTWINVYLSENERPLVDRLVEIVDVPHVYLPRVTNTNQSLDEIVRRNGGNIRIGSQTVDMPAEMRRHYEGEQGTVFLRGYGGEILRGFYNARTQRPMKSLSVTGMRNAYSEKVNYQPEATHKEAIEQIFEAFQERAQYSKVVDSGYDPCDIFYWEHRMGMWGSTMLNEYDVAMYNMVGLNSRKLYASAFGLQPDERLTKQLLRQLIQRVAPAIGAVETVDWAG